MSLIKKRNKVSIQTVRRANNRLNTTKTSKFNRNSETLLVETEYKGKKFGVSLRKDAIRVAYAKSLEHLM